MFVDRAIPCVVGSGYLELHFFNCFSAGVVIVNHAGVFLPRITMLNPGCVAAVAYSSSESPISLRIAVKAAALRIPQYVRGIAARIAFSKLLDSRPLRLR